MREVTTVNFGLLIAYVLPGFTALWGLSFTSPMLRAWLGTAESAGPTVGGFFYVTLASVAAGLMVSTVRWVVLDTLHHRTGIRQPAWNFAELEKNVVGFATLIEIHYRYYQWYGNMLVSLPIAYVGFRAGVGFTTPPFGWIECGAVVLLGLFFAGSRDTLRKYYERVAALLRYTSEPGARGGGLNSREQITDRTVETEKAAIADEA